MGSVHLAAPRGRVTGGKVALHQGLAVAFVGRVKAAASRAPRCCANCAGSLEFGAVLSDNLAYCSVECSLGRRPV